MADSSDYRQCCLCAETIGHNQYYTACCSQPICLDCHGDLNDCVDNQATCLQCQQNISGSNLVDPIAVMQAYFSNNVESSLVHLQSFIKPYTKAVSQLETRLADQSTNLLQLRASFANDPIELAKLDQEYYRVIKPLATTIYDNQVILTRLKHLHQQLINLKTIVSNQPFTETVLQQGRAVQLAQQSKIRWPKPVDLVVKPLWLFRHPLKASLIKIEVEPFSLSKDSRLVKSLNHGAIDKKITAWLTELGSQPAGPTKGYHIYFHEINPGDFVVVVAYQEDCFVFNMTEQLIVYLPHCSLDSVRINADYLVYQDSSDGHYNTCYVKLESSAQSPLNLAGAKVITVNPVTILALEQDQLWYCDQSTKKLCGYKLSGQLGGDLDNNVNDPTIINFTGVELISYHRGVYCVIESSTKRPLTTAAIKSTGNYYYLIKSVAYPEAALESKYEPKIYCDGTVVFHNGYEWLICYREDLSQCQPVGWKHHDMCFDKTITSDLTSDCKIMTWTNHSTRRIYLNLYQ